MQGRKPKPTKLKILTGNPGKRELNAREPQPAGKADCPPWLDAVARAEWNRIAPELERLGLLTAVDQAALAAYCDAYSEMMEANAEIQASGRHYFNDKGEPKPHPAVARKRAAWAALRAFAAEFGFSPAARTRIKPDKSAGDDLDQFLHG